MPGAYPWRQCARYSKKRTQAPVLQRGRLWKKKEWCIPKLSGEFVARMEDVLDLYHEEYDRERPVVCFDESSKQLLGDVRPPIETAPVRPLLDGWSAMTPSTSETGPGTCSCSVNRRVGGGMSR